MPERTKKPASVQKSSGNVFSDVGHPAPEVALARAELARRIALLIKRKGLTQTAAGELMGADQPKVSALFRGHLNGFSVERLLGYLTALGCDVDIVVNPGSTRRRSEGQIRVKQPANS